MVTSARTSLVSVPQVGTLLKQSTAITWYGHQRRCHRQVSADNHRRHRWSAFPCDPCWATRRTRSRLANSGYRCAHDAWNSSYWLLSRLFRVGHEYVPAKRWAVGSQIENSRLI